MTRPFPRWPAGTKLVKTLGGWRPASASELGNPHAETTQDIYRSGVQMVEAIDRNGVPIMLKVNFKDCPMAPNSDAITGVGTFIPSVSSAHFVTVNQLHEKVLALEARVAALEGLASVPVSTVTVSQTPLSEEDRHILKDAADFVSASDKRGVVCRMTDQGWVPHPPRSCGEVATLSVSTPPLLSSIAIPSCKVRSDGTTDLSVPRTKTGHASTCPACGTDLQRFKNGHVTGMVFTYSCATCGAPIKRNDDGTYAPVEAAVTYRGITLTATGVTATIPNAPLSADWAKMADKDGNLISVPPPCPRCGGCPAQPPTATGCILCEPEPIIREGKT